MQNLATGGNFLGFCVPWFCEGQGPDKKRIDCTRTVPHNMVFL